MNHRNDNIIYENEDVVVTDQSIVVSPESNTSVNVYNDTNQNQVVVTSGKKIVNEEWTIPKNIPVYTEEEIPLLTEKEKDEYRAMRKCASKFKRYVEVKKYHDFYLVSLLDLLPLFIGQIFSLVKLMVAYGDAKRTINFNKKLMSG
ncbi:MAG: hypothetical protein K2N99_01800, partial [Malacoplasma sp.]|nr:hypothetical protein [Malacoplasma sp.]